MRPRWITRLPGWPLRSQCDGESRACGCWRTCVDGDGRGDERGYAIHHSLDRIGLPIVGGLVLTGSLLRFMPGWALVSGFSDLIDQSIISGSARLAEALLLGAGVAAGTGLALVVAGSFGVEMML